jgi:hypothetical protein
MDKAIVVTPATEAWLLRWPGRYVIDGVIQHEEILRPDEDQYETDPVELAREDAEGIDHLHKKGQLWSRKTWSQLVQGKGDCIAIGDGAGIQCVINVSWSEMWGSVESAASKVQLGGLPELSPALILAGTVPGSGEIRFLLVDKRGLGHPGRVTLEGNAAFARPPCVDMPGVQECQLLIKIDARPGSALSFAVVTNQVHFFRSTRVRGEPSTIDGVTETVSVSFSLHAETQSSSDPEPEAPPNSP